MKVLIDMNLSPEWVDELKKNDIEASHWTTVGRYNAADSELMEWARKNSYIIFTHDLDFGTALALTKAEKPSVIQVRSQNVTVNHLSAMVITTLKSCEEQLTKGALVILEEDKKRIRILPLTT